MKNPYIPEPTEEEQALLQPAAPAGPPALTVVPQVETQINDYVPKPTPEELGPNLGPSVPFENNGVDEARAGIAAAAAEGIMPGRDVRLETIAKETGLNPQELGALTSDQLDLWEQDSKLEAISQTGQNLLNALKDPEAAVLYKSLEEMHKTETALNFKSQQDKFEAQDTLQKNVVVPAKSSYWRMMAGVNLDQARTAAALGYGYNKIDEAFERDPKDLGPIQDIIYGIPLGERKSRYTYQPNEKLQRYASILTRGGDPTHLREQNMERMSEDMRDHIENKRLQKTVLPDVGFNAAVAGSTGDLMVYLMNNPASVVRLLSDAAVTTVPAILGGAINPLFGASLAMYTETVQQMDKSLADSGVDTNDPVALMAALNNAPLMQKVKAEGVRKGLVTAVVDFFLMKVAGKLLVPAKIGEKVLTPWQKVGLNVVPQAVAQGTGEAASEAAGSLASTGDFDVNEIILEGIAGSLISPVDVLTFGGGRIHAEFKDFNLKRRASKTTKAWVEQGEKAIENVKNVPAAVTHMQKVAEVMAAKMNDNGVEEVFITAEDLWTFHQEHDADVLGSLGLDAETVQRAGMDGGLISVSSATFSRHILGVDGFDALLQHTKYNPEEQTAAEDQDFLDNGEEAVQAAMEATADTIFDRLNGEPEYLIAARTDYEFIRDTVQTMALAGGGVTNAQAALQGMVIARRYTTRALAHTTETGVTTRPLTLWQQANLQFAGPLTPEQFKRAGDPPFVAIDPLTQSTAWRELLVSSPTLNAEGNLTEASLPAGQQFDNIQNRRETAERLRDCLGAG